MAICVCDCAYVKRFVSIINILSVIPAVAKARMGSPGTEHPIKGRMLLNDVITAMKGVSLVRMTMVRR